jgi:hypothetical protein
VVEAREVKWQFAYVQSGGLLSHYNDCWLMIRPSATAQNNYTRS